MLLQYQMPALVRYNAAMLNEGRSYKIHTTMNFSVPKERPFFQHETIPLNCLLFPRWRAPTKRAHQTLTRSDSPISKSRNLING